MEQDLYQKIKIDFDKVKQENEQLKSQILKVRQEKQTLNETITNLIKQIDVEKIDIAAVRENLLKENFSSDEINSLIFEIDKIDYFFLEREEKKTIELFQKKISKTADNFQKIKVFKSFLEEISSKNYSCYNEFQFIQNADSELLNKEINFLIEKINSLKILQKEEPSHALQDGIMKIKNFLEKLGKI